MTSRTALALLLSLALPALARADERAARGAATTDDDASLESCVDDAVEVLRERGAEPMGEATQSFLTEGDTDNRRIVLPGDTCIGVLAVGRELVRDLDVALYTSSGIALERDVAIEPYSWVRFCGAEGLELVVSVRMYKGRGEYRLVSVTDAPRRLPDLNRLVGRCFAAGTGVRRPSPDVGPEPPGPDLDDELARVTEDLRGLGWKPLRQLERGAMRTRERARRRARLEAGRCYALAAIGGARVGDIDLVVASPEGGAVARDVERKRNAIVKLCARHAGTHVIEVRMYDGAGSWALNLFELEERRAGGRPPGLDGDARIPYAEVRARMRTRGMDVEPLAWGWSRPGAPLSIPVRLQAGRCYAFGGVTSEDIMDGDLDLVLLDDGDRLVGWEVGRGSSPLVYACPSRTAVHRVVGRVYGAQGRFLVLSGESRGRRP